MTQGEMTHGRNDSRRNDPLPLRAEFIETHRLATTVGVQIVTKIDFRFQAKFCFVTGIFEVPDSSKMDLEGIRGVEEYQQKGPIQQYFSPYSFNGG